MGVAHLEEEKDNIRSPSPSKRVKLNDENLSGNALERKKAVSALEEEKKTIYRELKSSLGEAEANVHIKEFMVSWIITFTGLIFVFMHTRKAPIKRKWRK
jgi:hypothetical protein